VIRSIAGLGRAGFTWSCAPSPTDFLQPGGE
jgi:hypothetical protein